jgi:hypothetical protein
LEAEEKFDEEDGVFVILYLFVGLTFLKNLFLIPYFL